MSSEITDPQVLAFIDRTYRTFPEDSAKLSWSDMRRTYDMMAEEFRQPRPVGIAVEGGALDGPDGVVPFRRYWPRSPGPSRVLYFHGGGFVLGGLDSHDDVCAEIADRCGTEVVAVDYRLAPEHRYPAAVKDALAAVDRFCDRPLVLVGDSAGGNLVAGVCIQRSDRVQGAVMIYPGLGGQALALSSYAERALAPMLTTNDIATYQQLYIGHAETAADPVRAPLLAQDLSGFPPAFISSAEHDPLRDDGPAFAERLADAGIAVEAVVEPELPHGHLRARHMSDRAGHAFDRIIAAITDFCDAAPARYASTEKV